MHFGARPLKRYLERQITNALSRRILDGSLPDGSTVQIVPGVETGLMVEREPAETAGR